jgi:hypothetical protein
MISKKLVPARSPSSILCLACARQGRPKLTKALRASGSFCGSTVDQHKPDKDLAFKDCAPGFPAGDFYKHIQPQAMRKTTSKPMAGNSKIQYQDLWLTTVFTMLL